MPQGPDELDDLMKELGIKSKEYTGRLKKLRTELDTYAKPLRDVDLLRQRFDELLAILLNEPE
jgi:SMC interacting uncharacterized protein involved in chromosome segregation